MIRQVISMMWRIIRRDRLALTGSVVVGLMILVALFAPLLAPANPNAIHRVTEGVAVRFHDGGWERPRTVGDRTLNAVAVFGDDEALAVGFEGEVMLFEANRWHHMDSPTEADLWGVAVAGSFAVAVGAEGTVLHLEEGSWRRVDAPTDLRLTAVALASPGRGLAVGEAGTALAWDGEAWRAVETGMERDLFGVGLAADGSGFAVGERGAILAWDGDRFDATLPVTTRDLLSVDVLDGTGLAVGERGTILRYADGRWTTMVGPELRELRSVVVVGPDQGLAVGASGVVLRMTEDRWVIEPVGYGGHLRGVAASDSGALAVGTDPFVNRLDSPSGQHLFGTTHLGRDVLSQTIWGSRTALMVGFLAALLVVVIGTNVGLIAGFFGGRIDNLLMRVVDVMYGLPFEPFALVLVLLFRPSMMIVILAIGLLTWRTTARIIRSQVLSVARRPFVKAARVAGASDWRILYIHIAPNVLPLVFLQLAVAMAFAITAEATLSFLGLGPPRVFSWGTMLHEARLSGAWRTAWWWILPPGVFIMLTVVSVFFIARALEVVANPRLAGGTRAA